MTSFARHLTAAHGFLELGLPLEAWNELEEIDPPQSRAKVPVAGEHSRERLDRGFA